MLQSESSDELILIEEVTDPVSCAKVPLLYPYALKLQQDQILQTYPIQYLNVGYYLFTTFYYELLHIIFSAVENH